MKKKLKSKYEQLCEAAAKQNSGEYNNVCASCGGRWKTLDELLAHRCEDTGRA